LASDVKQRMIEEMALLLARRGLQGASFSEVLEAAVAPRGSLYHHFPGGKDELVLAAMDRVAQRNVAVVDALKGRPAADVARGYIGAWRALLDGSSFQVGCAVMAVTVAADSPSLRSKAGEIFRTARTQLAEALRDGGVSPERAESLAAGLIAACEGAVGVARAEGSLAAFDLMAREQVIAIETATPRRRAPARRAAG
jgi:AcrR family transcriptional regulator